MEANCLDLKHGGARPRQRIQAAVHSVGVAYQGGFLEEGLDRSLNPRWHEWKGEPLHHLSLQTLTRMTQAGHQVPPLGRLPWAGKADSPALPCSPRGLLVASCTLPSVLLWRTQCVASQAGGNSRSLTEALL